MTVLESTWAWLGPFQGEVVGFVLTVLGAIVLALFRPRVKLIFGRATNSRNVISVPTSSQDTSQHDTEIYVEKYFLQNTGRKPATNVEFVLSSFPTDVSVFQPRDVQYRSVEKGNCLIQIPQIAPWELVIIDCAYINQRAAWVTSVKCAEVLGREVRFWTVRQFPNWFNWSFLVLCLLGFAMLVQIGFEVLASN